MGSYTAENVGHVSLTNRMDNRKARVFFTQHLKIWLSTTTGSQAFNTNRWSLSAAQPLSKKNVSVWSRHFAAEKREPYHAPNHSAQNGCLHGGFLKSLAGPLRNTVWTLTIACHDPRYFMFGKKPFVFSGHNLVHCFFETPREHGKRFSSGPGEHAKG